MSLSFDMLYKSCANLVRKIVRSHGFSAADAVDDLTQTIFLKAWQARETLQDDSCAKQWLSAIARNECRTALRSRKRQERLGSTALPSAPDATCPIDVATTGFWSMRPEEELTIEQKILHGVVLAMIEGRLGTPRVQVAKRYYVDGQTTAVIAAETGIPVNTVCSHLSRFRTELKDQLDTAS